MCVYACGVWSCAKMPDTRKCGEGRSLRDLMLHVSKRTAQTIMRTDGLRVALGGYAHAQCVCVSVCLYVCVCVCAYVCAMLDWSKMETRTSRWTGEGQNTYVSWI